MSDETTEIAETAEAALETISQAEHALTELARRARQPQNLGAADLPAHLRLGSYASDLREVAARLEQAATSLRAGADRAAQD